MATVKIPQTPLIKVDTALESLRSSGFTLEAAIGEPIDNSLEARANCVRIELVEGHRTVRRRKKESRLKVVEKIAFADDGDGMQSDVLERCLVLGFSTRYNSRSGMGRFGVGGTLAAISQARRVEIWSRASKEGSYHYSYIDLDEIMEGIQKYMPSPGPLEVPKNFQRLLDPKGPGTLVVWSKCDRLVEPPQTSGGQKIRTLEEVRTDIVKWIARTYRYFITDGTEIYVNGVGVDLHDPLFLMTSTRFPDDPRAELILDETRPWPIPSDPDREKPIRIRMTLLPEEWRTYGGAGGTTFARERRVTENEGFSIVRAKREIFFDLLPKFYPGGRKEIDRWIGLEISFDPELDEAFQVRNVKRGVEPVDELRHELRNFLKRPINTARERIRRTYRKYKNIQKREERIHEPAEKIAADVEMTSPKTRRGRLKPPEEQERRIEEFSQQAVEKEQKDHELSPDAYKNKLKEIQERLRSLPFSIFDEEWPGNELFDIEHLGQNTVIRYNARHPFFVEVYGKVLEAAGLLAAEKDEDSDTSKGAPDVSIEDIAEFARIIQIGIDLLIVGYAKAEAMDDHEEHESIYSTLRTEWGLHLKKMVENLSVNP